MHLVFPTAADWHFSSPSVDVDEDLVTGLTWDYVRCGITMKSGVAVLIQPPWILSRKDLEDFVECPKVAIAYQIDSASTEIYVSLPNRKATSKANIGYGPK